MSSPFGYVLYGFLLLGLLGVAEYRGWSLFTPTEVKGVPRTVRENPGVYRSHYRGPQPYFGGK